MAVVNIWRLLVIVYGTVGVLTGEHICVKVLVKHYFFMSLVNSIGNVYHAVLYLIMMLSPSCLSCMRLSRVIATEWGAGPTWCGCTAPSVRRACHFVELYKVIALLGSLHRRWSCAAVQCACLWGQFHQNNGTTLHDSIHYEHI
jgi:hypothetical protein